MSTRVGMPPSQQLYDRSAAPHRGDTSLIRNQDHMLVVDVMSDQKFISVPNFIQRPMRDLFRRSSFFPSRHEDPGYLECTRSRWWSI
jgi:hypothetical protein